MKKVMCFGTFDILHDGHRFYLTEAKKLGDSLVAVVARDETVSRVKRRTPVNNEQTRLRNLRQLGIADKVVLGNPGDKLKVIENEKPDVICLGYDQTFFTEQLKENLEARGLKTEIVRMPAFSPEKYKSSLMRSQKQ